MYRTPLLLLPLPKDPMDIPSFFPTPPPTFSNIPRPILFRTHFSFPLLNDEQGVNSPFPLGALVSPSANGDELGLVVVMPLSGRTAYWDSVGSAVAEGLFTKRRGVEGKVPLISRESVTAICNAEPAGFILSLSSGKLAHLALRYPAGRPGITVTIMRGYGTGIMGGFLGALRAGSSQQNTVAVRAGRILSMGKRDNGCHS
ncbi:hypothetical protein B9Z19DRAFT_367673 [Tuber borchii]|uniref:Nucleoporin Nup133/Nup155-like N-terminal domain-containing protein n=1 Tax=Tuber borchii TaxID=42251 RepID=A0A2T6ZI40_TUBBO|nr:hypothetical protein B9Z19DRAFT_367673 [Tuber borchii]